MSIETTIPLVCTYDSEANAAYIYLQHPVPAGAAEKTARLDAHRGMFNLDLNAHGHVVGLEILNAREQLPPPLLQAILRHDPTQLKNGQ
ncbi:DUF2283 domain-containing protein [Phytohabitans sp. ZYX-F-186]|uniref:DUF2283 domain-containing protein n=1 Tax=Phytohabitans maris TaxID=3071409 RepID=A0ABU0ZWF5_9ACTN|nr:DUF2283 domain-containing protein [Phytohabitans sp. ZYX-F-186]MDQ7911373.1 DUF2283 domain-containing protein [Phytohabitans sp. ZYX-F-186]